MISSVLFPVLYMPCDISDQATRSSLTVYQMKSITQNGVKGFFVSLKSLIL